MRTIHTMGMNLQTHTVRNADTRADNRIPIQIDKGKLNYGDRNQHNYCLRLHND